MSNDLNGQMIDPSTWMVNVRSTLALTLGKHYINPLKGMKNIQFDITIASVLVVQSGFLELLYIMLNCVKFDSLFTGHDCFSCFQ